MIRLSLIGRLSIKPILALRSTPYHRFATAASSSTMSTNKAAKKTLYQYLEIPPSATQNNIKQNYLRLAKIYHPDVYKGKDKTRF